MHYEGDPEYCREACPGPHIGDDYAGPESCPQCGGNGRACSLMPGGCRELSTNRPFEEFEGSTGAEEAYEAPSANQGMLW